MRKKKSVEVGKFEFSAALAEVSTRGRITAGLTLDSAAAQTTVDKRTIMRMEDTPAREDFRLLLATCSEQEAAMLLLYIWFIIGWNQTVRSPES